MIHVMLQNEAKPVDQSTVELGSVAISGVGGHMFHLYRLLDRGDGDSWE
jgi:hypothetical protein